MTDVSSPIFLIKNARILGGEPTDILIADGTIAEIAPGLDTSSPSGSDYSTTDGTRPSRPTA